MQFHPWHTNPSARFCSYRCRAESRRVRYIGVCVECGGRIDVKASQAKTYEVKYCSRSCKSKEQSRRLLGDGAPWYKGGWINQSGYRVISVDSVKWLEHRYVMSQHMGRPLRDDEDVHHLNHEKLDNRIENLILLSKSEHTLLHWQLRKHLKE